MSFADPVNTSQGDDGGIRHRIVYIVVLLVIILITALLIIIGYVVNTTIFASLANNPIYSLLPTSAKTAFGSAVTWTLSTYAFLPALVILLAIAGTIAAVFGLQSQPEDTEDF